MLSQRLAVRSRIDTSAEENLKKAFALNSAIEELHLSRVFWLLEKKPGAFSKLNLDKYLSRIFCDSISEDLATDFPKFQDNKVYVEVRFLGGVTDNWARSATEALALVSESPSIPWQEFDIEVHSGWQIELGTDLTQKQIETV